MRRGRGRASPRRDASRDPRPGGRGRPRRPSRRARRAPGRPPSPNHASSMSSTPPGRPSAIARGNGARMADDGVALLVPEHELQLGQLGAQEVPVAQGDLAVAHERRHRVLDLARPRGEIGAFGVREGVDGGAGSGRRRSFAPVPVLEPDDVVEVRRRDLDDERVLDRGHAVHGARAVAEDVVGRRSRSSRGRLRPRPARARRGPAGRATTRPSPRGTAGSATGRRGRRGACRRSPRSRPRRAPSPTASRRGAARRRSGCSREPLLVGGDVLVGAAELLRRVHRQPQPRVPERAQLSLRRRARGRPCSRGRPSPGSARAPPPRGRRSRS